MADAWHRFQARIERACALTGNSYPWWLAFGSTTATLGIAVAAAAQRGRPDVATMIALVLAFVPVGWWLCTARLLSMQVEAGVITASVVLFLLHPVNPDLAPLLLTIRIGEIAATITWPYAIAMWAVGSGVLVGAAALDHLDGYVLYLVSLALASDVGMTLRWYMRSLAAEREKTVAARQAARSDERRRIAREVHDVVGHSLSITLLHVTAARHALQQHADIADALESLSEAEQVGRDAMADVRRSVSVLGTGDDTAPLPGLADLEELIGRSRTAGMDVSLNHDTTARVNDVTGLELYRIVQESLANAAKHAPTASVRVELGHCADGLRLSVRNTLPAGALDRVDNGLGLSGMAARARQMGGRLHAGADGDDWVVDVVVPSRG